MSWFGLMSRRVLPCLVAACFIVMARPAVAQDYPNRPITLIVPFAAGGSSDVNARLIAEQNGQDGQGAGGRNGGDAGEQCEDSV